MKPFMAMRAIASLLVALPVIVLGQDNTDEASFLENLRIEGQFRLDSYFDESKEFKDDLRLRNIDLKFTAQLEEKIRLVLVTRLSQHLRQAGEPADFEFELERFLKEAKIEFAQVAGLPLVLAIGKQEMAFGQDYTRLPIHQNSPLHEITEIDKVMGFTSVLDHEFFQLFDELEVSVFDSTPHEFRVSQLDSLAVRVTRALARNTTLQASYTYQGNSDNSSLPNESLASIGVITKSGQWIAWSEAVGLISSSEFPNSDFGIQTGVSRRLWHGELAAEVSYVDDEEFQLALGYWFEITPQISLGAEARQSWFSDDRAENRTYGFRLQYRFGNENKYNKNPLFGPSGRESVLAAQPESKEAPVLIVGHTEYSREDVYQYAARKYGVDPGDSSFANWIFPAAVRDLAWTAILESKTDEVGVNVSETEFRESFFEAARKNNGWSHKELRTILVELYRDRVTQEAFNRIALDRHGPIYVSPSELWGRHSRYRETHFNNHGDAPFADFSETQQEIRTILEAEKKEVQSILTRDYLVKDTSLFIQLESDKRPLDESEIYHFLMSTERAT